MYRFKKIMGFVGMVTILFFSFQQNVYATGEWLSQVRGAPLTAAQYLANSRGYLNVSGDYVKLVAPAVAAGLSAPAWVPYAIAATTIIGVVAGLTYLYYKDSPKTIDSSGVMTVPTNVQWVTLGSDGKASLNEAENVASGKTSGAEIQNKVLASDASKLKYANLAAHLQRGQLVPLSPSNATLGGVYSWQGHTIKLSSMRSTNVYQNTPDAMYCGITDNPPDYNQCSNTGTAITVLSNHLINSYWVTAASPPIPTPIPVTEIPKALEVDPALSGGPVSTLLDPDLNQLFYDQPSIVHFDDPPSSVKSASDTAINTAMANSAATDAGAASISASSAASAAASAAVTKAAGISAAADAAVDTACGNGQDGTNNCLNAITAAEIAKGKLTDAETAAGMSDSTAAAAKSDATGIAALLGVLSSIWQSVTDFIASFKKQRVDDDAAINGTALPANPALGNYSGGRIAPGSLPEKKDIKSGVSDFLSHSPALSILKGLAIAPTNDSSDMSFQFQGRTITASFGHWDTLIGGVGTTMLVIVHGLGLLIVFKRE